jgi:site-specific DNA-methyltransferase (adenine-specific)
MGKLLDGGDIAFDPEVWRAVYRVLKPGAHLLAMGGTRTYHRLACAIEDAGFEIRDCVQWLYGSGFPKSHDVSKGIDRAAGAERQVVSQYQYPDGSYRKISDCPKTWLASGKSGSNPITAPATDAAREWEGWGTALKPAAEMICLARKPLSEGTVAANVLKWGTGALNIDACRVDHVTVNNGNLADNPHLRTTKGAHEKSDADGFVNNHGFRPNNSGRWPANVIHDGSEEVTAEFPDTGVSTGGKGAASGLVDNESIYGKFSGENKGGNAGGLGDNGSAARFFYTAKADSDDRLGSKHPTVKPLDLIQYLVRLITPRGGTVLDLFAGTGTTGEAAFREGMRAVLIEREEEYCADVRRRMALALSGPEERTRESIKARGQVDQNPGPLFDWSPE